jgi:hypothetical protein
MHRTEGDNHLLNQFTDGPPGTTITANWLNAIQEEIAGVIEGAGMTVDVADVDVYGQLFDALKALHPHIVDVPSSATDGGLAGQFSFDASYLYICVATNTWRRVSISGGW